MARAQILFVLALSLVLLAVVIASATTDSASAPSASTPSVLTPIAKSPVPSDASSSDDIEDADAGGVGSPLGTTSTNPDHTADGNRGASFNGVSSVVAVAAISGASYLMF